MDTPDDDERDVQMDMHHIWCRYAEQLYDQADYERYKAAADRILARLDPTPTEGDDANGSTSTVRYAD